MNEPRIEVIGTEPCVQFAVESSSRRGLWHIVSFDLETEHLDCTCEAAAFYESRGLCRHSLSVIRYAAQRYQKKRAGTASTATARMQAIGGIAQ